MAREAALDGSKFATIKSHDLIEIPTSKSNCKQKTQVLVSRSPSRWPFGHCSRPPEFGFDRLLGRLVHEPERGAADQNTSVRHEIQKVRLRVLQIQDSNFQTQKFKVGDARFMTLHSSLNPRNSSIGIELLTMAA